jgi:hypothetical protein
VDVRAGAYSRDDSVPADAVSHAPVGKVQNRLLTRAAHIAPILLIGDNEP